MAKKQNTAEVFFVCLCVWASFPAFAQFIGGSYDGYAINSVTCPPAPGNNIFAGGSYDGFAINSVTCTPAPGTNIFAGGSYDGFAINSVTCTPASGTNVFAGASYDGFYVNYFSTVAGCGPIPLPIELLAFNAKQNGKEVDVAWTTVSEWNNDYFTVEKTTDMNNYEVVGKINGAGNSSVPLYYALVDHHPFQGVSYYLLTQTDFNGQYKSYGPVAVYFYSSGIAVYPTVSSGAFYITGNDSIINMEVYNMLGEKVCLPTEGNGSISAGNQELFVIDLSNRHSGIYFIKIFSINELLVQKVVVLH